MCFTVAQCKNHCLQFGGPLKTSVAPLSSPSPVCLSTFPGPDVHRFGNGEVGSKDMSGKFIYTYILYACIYSPIIRVYLHKVQLYIHKKQLNMSLVGASVCM